MKMNKYLKFISIVLGCFMMVLCITACGNTQNRPSDDTSEGSENNIPDSSNTEETSNWDDSETGIPYENITEPTLILSSANSERGKDVEIRLDIVNNPGIAAATFKIHYDKEILKLNNVAFNDGFGGDFDEPGTLNTPVSICWSSLNNISNDGLFLKLRFKVRDEATAESIARVSIECFNGDFCNINEDDILFDLISGNIKVK